MRQYFIVLVQTLAVLSSASASTAGGVKGSCKAVFKQTSDSQLSTAPASKAIIDAISKQVESYHSHEFNSLEHLRNIEAWGIVMTKVASPAVFKLMNEWKSEEPHTVDVVIFKSQLKELYKDHPKSFTGGRLDVEEFFKLRRLDYVDIQSELHYFRAGVKIRTVVELSDFLHVVKFATVRPYAIPKTTRITSNSLLPIPPSETNRIALASKSKNAEKNEGWLKLTQEGRVSSLALENILNHTESNTIYFDLIVSKEHLRVLPKSRGHKFDHLTVIELLKGKKITVNSMENNPATFLYKVSVSTQKELTALESFVRFVTAHSYLVLSN